jgi:hypothetical protein
MRKRKTECFESMIKPVDMRIVLDLRSSFSKNSTRYNYNEDILELSSRDVLTNLCDILINKLIIQIKQISSFFKNMSP